MISWAAQFRAFHTRNWAEYSIIPQFREFVKRFFICADCTIFPIILCAKLRLVFLKKVCYTILEDKERKWKALEEVQLSFLKILQIERKKFKKVVDKLQTLWYTKDVKRQQTFLFKKGADNYGRKENHKERSSRNDVSR